MSPFAYQKKTEINTKTPVLLWLKVFRPWGDAAKLLIDET